MFLILPIGFLKVFHRVPVVNFAIIALCVLIHILQIAVPGEWVEKLALYPAGTELPPPEWRGDDLPIDWILDEDIEMVHVGWPRQPWTVLTYAFVHADIFHLVGNMIFLFVFGCGLNADLGHFRFLAFYLFSAVIAGVMYLFIADNGLVGASGAICGVTGMVAAFYPRNEVRFWYLAWIFFFIRTGTFEVSALWAIGLWFAFDLWGTVINSATDNVAYICHLAGSLTGFAIGILMLKRGWIESDGFDIITWYMGGKVGRLSKRARKSAAFVRSRSNLAPPAAAVLQTPKPDDWAPIPLMDDDNTLNKTTPKPQLAPPDAPVSKKIETFFAANPRASAISEFDRAAALQWYRDYCALPTRKPLSNRALAGIARSAATERDVEIAIDAYTRLVLQLEAHPEKQAIAAIEAARFAAAANRPQQAHQYIEIARRMELSPKQKATIGQILVQIAST